MDFASRIRAAMTVEDADGTVLGTVERVEGDEIRLAAEPGGDPHRYLPLSLVDGVDERRVLIRARGDTAFGVAAEG